MDGSDGVERLRLRQEGRREEDWECRRVGWLEDE